MNFLVTSVITDDGCIVTICQFLFCCTVKYCNLLLSFIDSAVIAVDIASVCIYPLYKKVIWQPVLAKTSFSKIQAASQI